MTYAQYGKIEASDFNTIVGTPTTSTTGELNAVWAIGNGNKGLGQTAVTQVTQYNTIGYTDWASTINTVSNIASHQGSSITSITPPTSGTKITYLNALTTNINTVTTNRLNAASQGSTSSTNTTATAWSSSLTFTHTITFSNANQARYFFNAGGQIALTFYSPSGTGINALFNSLATACGTIVLSSPTSGTCTISSTSYNGITKVGGSGTVDTISANSGYYGLTTVNTLVFKQLASGTPSGYVNSFISVYMRTNGTQLSNGDNGNIITITTIWDEIPDGLTVLSGTQTTVTIRPPSSTYITNSWGTPTVSGSVTGS